MSQGTTARSKFTIPGTRWVRADLHVHTIDDHPNSQMKWPLKEPLDVESTECLRRYARAFLDSVIVAGIDVVGLTPHRPWASKQPGCSAVWQIVDEWQNGVDDRDVAYRDQIFGVFPGFEPNLADGTNGLHILFLFDACIPRDKFDELFTITMDGVDAWDGSTLQMSTRRAEEVFERFDNLSASADWGWMALAPHVDRHHGLFKVLKSQALKKFPCERFAGFEISNGTSEQEYRAIDGKQHHLAFMREHRQAIYHATDAYKLGTGDKKIQEIGHRFTWLKMSQPTIESMRQAFLAGPSRLRTALEEIDGRKEMSSVDLGSPAHPWLRQMTVAGKASFFDGQTFEFSPDLTCVIGGSMTGKSTLLDGIRIESNAQLPADRNLREVVETRGNQLVAGATIDCETTGGGFGMPLAERWPAVFFTQNELQQLTRSDGAIEDILARLSEDKTDEIQAVRARLRDIDTELADATEAAIADQKSLDDARFELERAERAAKSLKVYEEAGLDVLRRYQEAERTLGAASELVSGQQFEVDLPDVGRLESLDLGVLQESAVSVELLRDGLQEAATKFEAFRSAHESLQAALGAAHSNVHKVASAERGLFEKRLSERGYQASELTSFKKTNQTARLVSSYRENVERAEKKLASHLARRTKLAREREQYIADLRAHFDAVIEVVHERFDHIRVSRETDATCDALEEFVLGLKHQGITRWWNEHEVAVTPNKLLSAVESGDGESIGATETVTLRLTELIRASDRMRIEAMRPVDRYQVLFEVDAGQFRPLAELSGGQRVGVLLSLLLSSRDSRPLVIDQPEDELDNRMISETIIPALQRLKGRRQVILATHNANLIVNADADQVIVLRADANHGQVASSGSIDDFGVRRAIVETVDGGEEAFRLRRAKYGF